MATDKPRITISLSPEQHEVLKRLAALQKAPMSRIISELLEEVTPVLSNVADSLELAMRAQEGVKANIKRVAQEAEEDLRPLVEYAKNQFDLFNQQLTKMVDEDEAAGDGDGRRTAPSTGAGPQPVITGATGAKRAARKSGGQAPKAASTGASLRAK